MHVTGHQARIGIKGQGATADLVAARNAKKQKGPALGAAAGSSLRSASSFGSATNSSLGEAVAARRSIKRQISSPPSQKVRVQGCRLQKGVHNALWEVMTTIEVTLSGQHVLAQVPMPARWGGLGGIPCEHLQSWCSLRVSPPLC